MRTALIALLAGATTVAPHPAGTDAAPAAASKPGTGE